MSFVLNPVMPPLFNSLNQPIINYGGLYQYYPQANQFPHLPYFPRKHPLMKGYFLPSRRIHHLPLPLAQPAVDFAAQHFALPEDMPLLTAIGAMNFPASCIADIEFPGGRIASLSAYALLAASSGAGKTPLHKMLSQGLEEIEDELLALKLGDTFDPESPTRPMLFLDDLTEAGMTEAFKLFPYLSLVDTEASDSFDKWDKSTIKLINKLFDDDTSRKSRGGINGYNVKLSGRRLSIFWAQQPEVFYDFLKKAGGAYWKNVGALNRFLICIVDVDFSKIPVRDHDRLQSALSPFWARQKELMLEAFTPGFERKVVRLDKAAEKLYEHICIELRSMCVEDAYFQFILGHAAKLPDILLRVAATFHVFEGFEGDISESTLWYAYQVVLHYADYHVALFTPVPQSELDAKEIHEIIDREFRAKGSSFITPENRYVYLETIKSRLPSALKKGDRLGDALKVLGHENKVAVYWARQGTDRTVKQWVDLYPTWHPLTPPYWLTLGDRLI